MKHLKRILLTGLTAIMVIALQPITSQLTDSDYASAYARSGGGGGRSGGAGRSGGGFGGGRSFGNSGGGDKSNSGRPSSGSWFGNSGGSQVTPKPSRTAPVAPQPTQSRFGNSGVAAGAVLGGAAVAHTATASPAPTEATRPPSSTSVTPPAPAAGKYGNSGGAATGATSPVTKSAIPPKTPLQEQMDRTHSKQESTAALKRYEAEQRKFTSANPSNKAYVPPTGTQRATIDRIRNRVRYSDANDYYTRRNTFYSSHNNWAPPAYAYNSPSSFGMWDTIGLWFMMDHFNDSQYRDFYYAHRDDPEMREFRKEVEELSADNKELAAKLAAMDTATKDMQAKGVVIDPTFVPDEAADVMLAAQVAEKEIRKDSGISWWWWVLGLVGLVLVVGILLPKRG